MTIEQNLYIILAISIAALVAAFVAAMRAGGTRGLAADVTQLLRDGRVEASQAAKEAREELARIQREGTGSLAQQLASAENIQREQLSLISGRIDALGEANQVALDRVRTAVDTGLKEMRAANDERLGEIRSTLDQSVKELQAATEKQLGDTRTGLDGRLKELRESNEKALGEMRGIIDARIKELREGNEKILGEMRKEVSDGLKQAADSISKVLGDMSNTQREQLQAMTGQLKEHADGNLRSLEAIRTALDARVKELQASNEEKLEQMRKTVDEKLHDTLERRLGESFKLVSDRLDTVHKGLGEMQTLATGVGDLKRVLTNVKARGGWAELQLGALLEQTLTPEQYEKNVAVTPGGSERVEFAIKLPGSKGDPNTPLWLAIDSKFPQEDYARLQHAAERADPDAVKEATDGLLRAVRLAAKDIHDKYINPPHTLDMAVMYLATEGLFSEVMRQPGFVEELQTKYRVMVTGPANLTALLTTLRLGFQTLAIEKRASDVWRVLGAVKTEFGKFGDMLDKVKNHLGKATKTIEEGGVRTRAMERQLREVEKLPEFEASQVLALPSATALLTSTAEYAEVVPEADVEN